MGITHGILQLELFLGCLHLTVLFAAWRQEVAAADAPQRRVAELAHSVQFQLIRFASQDRFIRMEPS